MHVNLLDVILGHSLQT